MSNDRETLWLRERMQELQQRRRASAPTFERVWEAVRVQRMSQETKPAWPAWALAGASFAAIALSAVLAFHTATERKQSREKEREFAAVDGVLMTYWQAPSDDLLPVRSGSDLPQSR